MLDSIISLYTYTSLFIIGLAMGSFLNVLADRLSNDESIFGRSHCDTCKRTLEWYELIPLVSYVVLRARCRTCDTHLSLWYPIMELVTGISYVLAWRFFPYEFFERLYPAIGSSVLERDFISPEQLILRVVVIAIVSVCIVMISADLKYFIIPDGMQIALGILALGLIVVGIDTPLEMLQRLGDGVLIMLPLLLVHLVTRGKGMGFGDVKLALNIGLLLGLIYGGAALYIAFVLGAIISLLLILRYRKSMKSPIPFGPFLVSGILIVLFFLPELRRILLMWYGIG